MILITGGAGYIGSHINKALNKEGYNTVVLDNLSRGYENFVKWGEFENCDLSNTNGLKSIFEKYDIEAVFHFAGFISVGESIEFPQMYFKNNYKNTLNLINVMKQYGVDKFIFSSTAAVYGNPLKVPIKEDHVLKPINPYGQSKLMVERALEKEDSIKHVFLRYFNASGSDPDCEIGELHFPETHLIPLILDAAIGKRDSISIYGDDYDTFDGTCIRDYIHVCDLAQAHIKALKYLEDGNESNVFNLGNGNGFSVKEVVEVCKKVTGTDFKVKIEDIRQGDPEILIADSTKAKEQLNWTPQYSNIEDIIKTAWAWCQKINGD